MSRYSSVPFRFTLIAFSERMVYNQAVKLIFSTYTLKKETIKVLITIEVEFIGLSDSELPSNLKGPNVKLDFENPVSLYELLVNVFGIRDADKVILVNGTYKPSNYSIQHSDKIKIFSRLDGG